MNDKQKTRRKSALWKKWMITIPLTVTLIFSGGVELFALGETVSVLEAASEPQATTEYLLREDYESEVTDGTEHSVPSVGEWKAGTKTAELSYQNGRVYLNKLNSEAYAADLVIPLNKGSIGGTEPEAPAAPGTDIYIEFDWQAHNTSTRLYLQGLTDEGKGVNLFYFTQSGSKMQYCKGDNSSNVTGNIEIQQTASHVFRLLMKRNGDSYTISKVWIDGVLDKELNLAGAGSCVGLYCFKTDERRTKGTGLGSSFGELNVWQPAADQIQTLLETEGASPDFEDIKGDNLSETEVTGDLTMKVGELTEAGLLITGWESSVPEVIREDGVVNRPKEEDCKVMLTPTLAIRDVIGDGSADFQPVNVTGPGNPVTVTVKSIQLEEVKERLSFELIRGKNESADAVTRDLTLFQALDGVSISWEVSSITPGGTNAAIDVQTGSVRRPLSGEEDVVVVLKANLSRGTETDSKTITVTVKKMDMSPDEYVKEIAGWLAFADIAGENPDQNQVTTDLNLIRSFNGADVVWQSSDPNHVSVDGTVRYPIFPDPAVTVTLTAELTYAGSGKAVKTFTVTVQPGDPENLAKTGEIKSNLSGVSAADLEKIRDGKEDTCIEVQARSKSFYLIFDLKEKKAISKFEYTETAAEELCAIETYQVDISENGTSWTTVFEGTGLPGKNTAEFEPVETRYVRFLVSKKTAGRVCTLAETAVRFRPSDQALVEADARAFEIGIPARITGNTITLPLKGKFGSDITWEIKPAGLIQATAAAGTYQVTHGSSDRAVTLTATFHSGDAAAQRRSSHSISGTGNGSFGGSTGGSGGSSRPSGGSSVSTGSGTQAVNPKLPAQQTEQTPETEAPFRDLEQAQWAAEYIQGLYNDGIVNGKEEGLFHPMDTVTREEFVKMLVLSLGLEPVELALEFEDVEPVEWYAPYIACAVQEKIANGVSETQFGIGLSMTREDAAVMIARTLQDGSSSGSANRFVDQENISEYARDSVARLAELELIQGDEDGRFRPQDTISRAETAKILYLLRSAAK